MIKKIERYIRDIVMRMNKKILNTIALKLNMGIIYILLILIAVNYFFTKYILGIEPTILPLIVISFFSMIFMVIYLTKSIKDWKDGKKVNLVKRYMFMFLLYVLFIRTVIIIYTLINMNIILSQVLLSILFSIGLIYLSSILSFIVFNITINRLNKEDLINLTPVTIKQKILVSFLFIFMTISIVVSTMIFRAELGIIEWENKQYISNSQDITRLLLRDELKEYILEADTITYMLEENIFEADITEMNIVDLITKYFEKVDEDYFYGLDYIFIALETNFFNDRFFYRFNTDVENNIVSSKVIDSQNYLAFEEYVRLKGKEDIFVSTNNNNFSYLDKNLMNISIRININEEFAGIVIFYLNIVDYLNYFKSNTEYKSYQKMNYVGFNGASEIAFINSKSVYDNMFYDTRFRELLNDMILDRRNNVSSDDYEDYRNFMYNNTEYIMELQYLSKLNLYMLYYLEKNVDNKGIVSILSRNVNIFLLLVSLLLIFALGIMTKHYFRQLDRITLLAKSFSYDEFDLTKKFPIEANDEVGEIVNFINYFIDRQASILVSIKGNTSNILDKTNEINTTLNSSLNTHIEHNDSIQESVNNISYIIDTIDRISVSISQQRNAFLNTNNVIGVLLGCVANINSEMQNQSTATLR